MNRWLGFGLMGSTVAVAFFIFLFISGMLMPVSEHVMDGVSGEDLFQYSYQSFLPENSKRYRLAILFDYECPPCHQLLDDLRSKVDLETNVLLIPRPLSMHPLADPASRLVTQELVEQQKWNLHAQFLDDPASLTFESVEKLQGRGCLSTTKERVNAFHKSVSAFVEARDINATPTVLRIDPNGKVYRLGKYSLSQLLSILGR
jgi:hypothetical protein